jgi:cell wall-associated NlpC family hydrolase
MGTSMRRHAILLVLLLAFPVTASAAAGSWAQPQIKAAVTSGLMSGGPAGFRPNDPLLPAELAQILTGLTGTATTPSGQAPITLGGLDSSLVRAEGLGDAAYRFYLGARRAGLAPPARFGTEAVARLIGLRVNHPAAQDTLELQPAEPATRAEAAFSVVKALELDDLTRRWVKGAASVFDTGPLTDWQRRILTTAVRFIGYPYVWGGEDETTERGFDCSGFVWRVYKLQDYPGGDALADVLQGRTSYQMSGEVAPAERIGFDGLEPGDVLFFGPKGERSKPRDVDHMGLYLGNGWMIHSSRYGVALAPLDGSYSEGFAWARRPLAEAGLESLT